MHQEDILSWAWGHDCLWYEYTCTLAALGGHLDVLKWAREHGCPWDVNTCACATMYAPLEVLRWAMEHGAPVNPAKLEWYEHVLRGESHPLTPWMSTGCRVYAVRGV